MKQVPTWALMVIHYLLSQALGVIRGNEAYAVLTAYLAVPPTAP